MTEPADTAMIDLLVSRDGIPTAVRLANGATLTVFNIAWGYDFGDDHAHVTTNASPGWEGVPMDFFFTSEVESIFDPDSHEALY